MWWLLLFEWWKHRLKCNRGGSNFCLFFLKEGTPTLKGALSGLWQFLAIESPLKMTENAAYFVFKILKFMSWLFGHVTKQLD